MNRKLILLEKQKFLMLNDVDYEITICNSRIELNSQIFKDKYLSGKSKLKPLELGFIRRVKNYVKKNKIYENKIFEKQYFSDDVFYTQVNPKVVKSIKRQKTFRNVIEIDIDNAYFDTAFLLGIISKDLYERGMLKVSKRSRLISLGALAKKERIYKYKGLEMISSKEVYNPLTANLWFHISKRISDVMVECLKATEKNFLFYWVDGIYLQDTKRNLKYINNILEIMQKYGYNAKIKRIDKIVFYNKNFKVYDDEENDKFRLFNYPVYDKKTFLNKIRRDIKLQTFLSKIKDDKFDILEEVQNRYHELIGATDLEEE